jgi:hypothetical protein
MGADRRASARLDMVYDKPARGVSPDAFLPFRSVHRAACYGCLVASQPSNAPHMLGSVAA